MIGEKILNAVAGCFYVYYLLMVVRCLLTFLPGLDWNNSFCKTLILAVDPFLNLFRKVIPPVGVFDFSPILAFFALEIIRFMVLNILAFVLRLLGLL